MTEDRIEVSEDGLGIAEHSGAVDQGRLLGRYLRNVRQGFKERRKSTAKKRYLSNSRRYRRPLPALQWADTE